MRLRDQKPSGVSVPEQGKSCSSANRVFVDPVGYSLLAPWYVDSSETIV